MQALVFDNKLRFERNYPDPRATPAEALVRVHLAGICNTDLEIVRGYMHFRGVPGHEFVGVVESGPSPWLNKRVVAEINCVCRRCDMCTHGLRNHCRNRTIVGIAGRDGAFAERLAVPVENLHEVPDALTDEQAVFIEPLAAAVQLTSQVPLDARTTVTVLGPGKLGLLVAQVVALKGCKLQVVGRSMPGLEFAEKRALQTYLADDLVQANDQDVVIDCTGNPQGLQLAMNLVRPRGTIVLKSTYSAGQGVNLTPVVVNEVTIVGSRCGPFPQAISLLAQDKVEVRTMISRQFALAQGRQAFDYAAQPGIMKVLLKMP